MKRVTIKDVAREAGVSISTVSNALNGVNVLNPKTKAHVLEVAARLNYIPNPFGQGLRSKEAKAIGLFVSELTGNYYNVLADTMHWACQRYGYDLNIYITSQCSTILNNIIGQRVDGAVIFYEDIRDETMERLRQSARPIVFLDREVKDQTISSVVFDSNKEGMMATEYLISLGHRDIMHMYGLKGNYDSAQRYQGYRAALKKHGLTTRPENLLYGLFEQEESYREFMRYLEQGHALPDAIFAANDLSAIGCFKALRDAGYRVPEDISLIGCDDIDVCELMDPPLTTIHTNFQNQSEIVIDLLMKMLNKEQEGVIRKMNGQLIIRQSAKAKQSAQD